MKDYAIKLFGKTINVFPDKSVSDESVSEQRHNSFATSTSQNSKDDDSLTRSRNGGDEEEETLTATSSEVDDDTNTNKPNKAQEKTLKKPDKIVPCPRCNSMDTKFCYYNNYNVNQPRYFCKKCQRYWTSGGTMRNVPVGSGRRKSKNTQPNFHHIMVSESGFLIGPNSGFPVAFYPGAYWNVPTLGKHSREESGVLFSNKVVKSSRETSSGSLSGTGIFRAFESKGGGGRSVDGATMALQANPAAFSRSINFHESA